MYNLDLGTTESIMNKFRTDKRVTGHKVLVIALSGILARNDVQRMEHAGANGVLVGESLMLVRV